MLNNGANLRNQCVEMRGSMSYPSFRPLPSLLDPSVIPKAKPHTPIAHGPAAGGGAQTQAQGGVQKVTLHRNIRVYSVEEIQ